MRPSPHTAPRDRSRILFLARLTLAFWALLSTAQAQSRLTATLSSADSLRLLWTGGSEQDRAEFTPALGSASVWTVLTNIPIASQGQYSLLLPLGNTPRYFRLRSASAATGIVATSPADGETGVSVTRESILELSSAIRANTLLSGAELTAQAAGRRILTRTQISHDRRKLTLFYLEPLPAGARVRVMLEGSLLTDESSREIDADGDGVPGGLGEFSFETMSLAANANTAVIGRVYASTPNPDGSNRPLENVTVTVDGAEETLRTTTDAEGRFTLKPAPTGRFFVHVDGRTAAGSSWPDGSYYPVVGKAWDAIAGKTNNLASGSGEIFLPLIGAQTLTTVSAASETVIGFTPEILAANPALAGTELRVPANTLFSDNGSRGGKIGIAPVPPNRLPEPLPPGLNLPLVFTVQTDGPQNFDQPIAVRFPNLPDPTSGAVAPPGSKVLLWSFNHDTGRWEPQGTMTISEDGKFAVTDPGVGMRQPGWHGAASGSGGSGPRRGGGSQGGSGGGSSGGGGNCPDGEDCECTQDVTCTIRHEGRHYALCALDCLGNTLDRLFNDPDSTPRSPIDSGLRCIGGPDLCPGRPEDVLTEKQRACMDACRFPNPEYKTYTIPCEGAIYPCPSPSQHSLHAQDASSNAAIPDTDRLAEQEFFWDVQADYFVKWAGTPRIVELTYEEMPVLNAFFDAYRAAVAPASPSGLALSTPERTALIAMPRPAAFSLAEWTAMIDRLASLEGKPLPADVLAASQRIDDAVTLLKARGWKYHNDGLVQGLARLSRARAPELGSDLFPRAAHYYLLKNHRNGFIQRGRLNANGQFEGLILAPEGFYTIVYLDPNTGRTGAAFFPSAVAGVITILPTAPLEDLPASALDSDADGSPDLAEEIVGTSPILSDTDGDGIPDTTELRNNTNPNDGTPAITGILGTIDTPGTALGIHAVGDHAFIADGDAGLTVLRLNGFERPTLATTLPLSQSASRITGSGTLLALGLESAVALVDASDPNRPRLLKQHDLGGRITTLELDGTTLFAAANGNLLVLDALTGTVLQRLPSLGADIQDIRPVAERLFVLTSQELLAFLRVDGTWSPAGRVTFTSSPNPAELGRRLQIDNQVARIGVHRGPATGLYTYDISTLTAMQRLSAPTTLQATALDLASTGSKRLAVITSGSSGTQLALFDAGNPATQPAPLTSFALNRDAAQSVTHNGLLLVAGGSVGVSVVNFLPPDRGTNPPSVTLQLVTDNALRRGEYGGTARVLVQASDDVGIRSVDLEIEGILTTHAQSSSLTAIVPLPARNSGRTHVTLRARATDLAGLTTWTSPVVLELVDDAMPPAILELSPPSGAVATEACLTEISVRLDEPVATPLDSESLKLFTPGPDGLFDTADDVRVPGAVTYDAAGRILRLMPSVIPGGTYRAILAAGVGDAAGNTRLLPVTWLFQDSPLPRVVVLPEAATFRFGVPLEEIVVGLDHPLCAAARDSIQWGWWFAEGNGVPDREIAPLQVIPDSSGRSFVIRSPEPLGTGRYRLTASGPAIIPLNYVFQYRNSPNTGLDVNGSTVIWSFSPGLVFNDIAEINIPGRSAFIQFPSFFIQRLTAFTDVAVASTTVRITEPAEYRARLLLGGNVRLEPGSSHVRGPLVLGTDASLRGHTIHAYGGGYLNGTLTLNSADSALVNHAGSSLVVSNGFNDANSALSLGNFLNEGTLVGESSANLDFPVRLERTRLVNSGQIELRRGAWLLTSVDHDGTLDLAAKTRFTFAQRLRADPASRITGAGTLAFGFFNTSTRRVQFAADADLQGEVLTTGPILVDAGTVTFRRPLIRTTTNDLSILNGGTLQCMAQADLAHVTIRDSDLRFNADAHIGRLNVDGFANLTTARRTVISESATVGRGLAVLGQGTLEFEGVTVQTNGTQPSGLAVGDATLINRGTWRMASAGAAGSSIEIRRANNLRGTAAFENRGLYEQITRLPLSFHVPVRNYGRMVLARANVLFDARGSTTTERNGRFEPQPGSELVLNDTTFIHSDAGSLDLAGGTVSGRGTLRTLGTTANAPHTITNRGVIRVAPDSDLTLDTTGGFRQTATGEIHLTLSSFSLSRLILGSLGSHQLDGTLRISLPATGMDPAIGTAFVILTHSAGSITGTFRETILPDLGPTKKFVVRYEANAIRLMVTAP